MKFKEIVKQIGNFKVSEEMEDYEISKFFNEIRNELPESKSLTESQKKQLIKSLFGFLKNQDPEMDENFSFVHFIEDIDNPNYKIYNSELIKFNKENGIITSTLLLNRHINSLEQTEWKDCVELLKCIAENENHTENVREFALDFYEHQIAKKRNANTA